MKPHCTIVLCALLAVLGCAAGPKPMDHATQADPKADPKAAPLFEGMGDYTFPVTTSDPLAQRYVSQGMVLAHGFNHAEAGRSFRAAAAIDPDCAMAHWGVAIVLGPNINAAMDPGTADEAYQAAQMAIRKMVKATPREQALISALAQRYDAVVPEDRTNLDVAYANAMTRVWEAYPKDPDIGALCAEAQMNLHPWDFWLKNGEPQPWTPAIVETLERVLELDPNHPLACHLYIHAVEASPNPEKAEAVADRLLTLVPNAGHLVHMPSHIYINIGRYHDGSTSNELALKADDAYVAACYAQGMYPLAYYPHNSHFLFACTMLEGRSADCIAAAEKTAGLASKDHMAMPGFETLQHFAMMDLFAYVRFAKWDKVLAAPQPADTMSYPMAVWHYARGAAYVGLGDLDKARAELVPLGRFADDPALAGAMIGGINAMSSVLAIARADLSARIAEAEGDYDEAIGHYTAALAVEQDLRYTEPPDWFYPVRLGLGGAYLKAGRYAEAEQAYRSDLEVFPEYGWALFGLAQALEGQGKTDEAADASARFKTAWRYADYELAPMKTAMR